jgi:hypothetical protein
MNHRTRSIRPGMTLIEPATLDLAVWRAQGTRAGGEVVE